MAIISQGILGGISGKIGNVVGGSWKGIDYLRIMPASVANPKNTCSSGSKIQIYNCNQISSTNG